MISLHTCNVLDGYLCSFLYARHAGFQVSLALSISMVTKGLFLQALRCIFVLMKMKRDGAVWMLHYAHPSTHLRVSRYRQVTEHANGWEGAD